MSEEMKLPEGFEWLKVGVPVPPAERLTDDMIGELSALAAEGVMAALIKRKESAS